MKIAMDKLCNVFSRGLDLIEKEQIGASENHSMRVAALCAVMGKKMGYDGDTLSALATCALFHDNALTEFHLSERELELNGQNVILHCEKGQSNVAWLPFRKNIDGIILYHHERGDGKGPFNKKEGEYPFEAALLGAADVIDVRSKLQKVDPKDLAALREKIKKNPDIYSTRNAVEVLLDILDHDMLISLRDENISQTLDKVLPHWEIDVCSSDVFGIAEFISHVIDYKSKFTRKHTSQIANRSWLMAKYYGYSDDEQAALYLAASLHDIGKIATPTEVLEKPGKLNAQEFEIIKKHVWYTHEWLLDVPDFELIRNWAANHHEKLDGSGYSFGRKADELDFNSRLIACLDIYQAVSEPRPYHDARPHESTMRILKDMAAGGVVDGKIVKDIDEVMGTYSMQDIPSPRAENKA
ncbi:MAG: HD domain-containing protein [Oscillospiraceae bacterium]|nr:HD domain-containing protein [Oscillospiraceae bacterium]